MKRYLEKIFCIFKDSYSCGKIEISRKTLEDMGCLVENFTYQEYKKNNHLISHNLRTLYIVDDADFARQLIFKGQVVIYYLQDNCEEDLSGISHCLQDIEDIDYEYLDQVYCHHNDLSWRVMETDRLIIREIVIEDVEALYEIYQEPMITKYMENLFPEKEDEIEYTQNYRRNVYGFYGYGIWILEEKLSGKIIGRAGLENKEGFDGLELGFVIAVEYQKKGFASEACKAIIYYARDHFEEKNFCALTMKDNIMSINLLKRLGFCYDKQVVDQQIFYDRYVLEYQ